MRRLGMAVWAWGLGACAFQVLAQTPLGTLLYAPAERAAILGARQGASVQEDVKSTTLRYQGVVQRSGAKSTVWINGKPLVQGDSAAPELKGTQAVVAGQPLRVGQSIDTTTGQRHDVVEPGAVVVRRTP